MGRPKKSTRKRPPKRRRPDAERSALVAKSPARASTALTVRRPPLLATLEQLAAIPEERVWLESQQSEQTRRAYRRDVQHFMTTLGISDPAAFRKVDRMAVLAWKRAMESEGAKPRTIRRRLSALSSLYSHLVHHRAAATNPVREIRRPKVNRRQGTTASFSPAQARALLDAPSADTLQGVRDRAILSVGLQVGPRRSEIASLTVKDFHENAGYPSLHFVRKGGEDHALAIHPQAAQRIRDYLELAGHSDDLDGPLFRPVRESWKATELRRPLHPAMIDHLLRRYARKIGVRRGFSAHSMRATFITRTLENGASLEEVQRAAGHADASTTKLYDRRGYNPEKSASFFANY